MFFCRNFRQKRQHTSLSDFDVKSNIREKNGKTAPVWKFLILHQIKLEKNGFHSLKERLISFQTIYNSYLKPCFLSEFEAKTKAHQFIRIRRQIEQENLAIPVQSFKRKISQLLLDSLIFDAVFFKWKLDSSRIFTIWYDSKNNKSCLL